ncbi:MAG: HAD hydrolase family protein, partial [Patescibacteria group bacterium]
TQAVLKAAKVMSGCLATGRILKNALPVITELQLTGLCVISNGIQIFDPRKNKIIEETLINQALIPELYELLSQFKVEIRQFDGNVDVPYYGEQVETPIHSLYIPAIPKVQADQIINSLSSYTNINTHTMLETAEGIVGIEICHVNASKLHGIHRVAQILKIPTHEIIGVGDGYNDFPLLMACGLKIAMGNAVPELKAIADFVVPPVEEDGVAVMIDKFILNV